MLYHQRKEFMQMSRNKEPTEESRTESRRNMLRKIGVALAATTVAASSGEARAQKMSRIARPISQNLKLPSSIKTAVSGDEGELKIFVATNKSGAASILVLKASDYDGVKLAQAQLHAEPASARVVNGVVQVNLGKAAEGRCNISSAAAAAIDFGNPPPVDTGPFTRQ
jgi:hypothetical protein